MKKIIMMVFMAVAVVTAAETFTDEKGNFYIVSKPEEKWAETDITVCTGNSTIREISSKDDKNKELIFTVIIGEKVFMYKFYIRDGRVLEYKEYEEDVEPEEVVESEFEE